jgi:hypothetical protein
MQKFTTRYGCRFKWAELPPTAVTTGAMATRPLAAV